jgi:hypothetical protein
MSSVRPKGGRGPVEPHFYQLETKLIAHSVHGSAPRTGSVGVLKAPTRFGFTVGDPGAKTKIVDLPVSSSSDIRSEC